MTKLVKKATGAKKSPTRRVKADTHQVMPRIQSRLTQETRPNVASGGEGEWPTDVPVNVEVERVMLVGKEFEGRMHDALLGHIIHLTCYTMGVGSGTNVQVRLYRDPRGMAIVVDDVEVYKWMLNPDDLPVKFKEFIEEKGRLDGAWAEQVELQPGDFVEENEDGSPKITRASRTKNPSKTRQQVVDETSPEGDIEWE